MSEQDVSIVIRARELTTEAFNKISASLKLLEKESGQVSEKQKGFSATLKDSVAHGELAGFSFTKLAGSWVAGALTLNTLTAGLRGVVHFISSSIKEFTDAEAAQGKLTTALCTAGIVTPGVGARFNELAAAFQRTTVYSDDLITEMQALLVQVGGVMPHQMKGALTAATNLAAGLGIDLRQAPMLVGKAFAGETGTLARYGIQVDETKLKTQGATAVLEAINEQFGGQAQARVDTHAGKVQQLGNTWDNLKEVVGEFIISDPILEAGIRAVSEASGIRPGRWAMPR